MDYEERIKALEDLNFECIFMGFCPILNLQRCIL